MTLIKNLKVAINKAVSDNEKEYAEDLQFIVDFAEQRQKPAIMKNLGIHTIQDAASWVGVNLIQFEGEEVTK